MTLWEAIEHVAAQKGTSKAAAMKAMTEILEEGIDGAIKQAIITALMNWDGGDENNPVDEVEPTPSLDMDQIQIELDEEAMRQAIDEAKDKNTLW